MKHISLQIEKMSCGHCIPDVVEALKAIDGVISAEGNENTDIVTVEFDETMLDISKMEMAVKETGHLII
ncbi:heavy-metal-associated domain-containing protein [Halalkalibacter alkalisediminis]|uniref:Heavy-metal-associated domain-containing protein n=1 Tax=Halalkalibacter alkalisediminis TaxID=935616 RepID=A0ABV6NJ23_9BACI|nr:heavy-metal-associated domain-containing protein [Halalkalibacter alkalisediminis]